MTIVTGQHCMAFQWRDLRVSARGVRIAGETAGQTQVTRFAEGLLQHYQGWCVYWPYLPFVFNLNRVAVTMHSVSYNAQMHVAPRLALTLLLQPLGSAQQSAQHGALHVMQRLVTRLITKSERIEGSVGLFSPTRLDQEAAPESTIDASPQAPAVPPVPRVVYRAAPSTTTVAAPPPMVTSRAAVNGWERAATDRSPLRNPGTPMQPEANPVEVHRLTEQVIQAIDRRIIAKRERLGRV